MAIQPITYRPVTAIKPVTRKTEDEQARKISDRQRPRRGRPLEPGVGENLDTWV